MAATWPDCRHRGEALTNGRRRCRHPRVIAIDGVTPATCQRCATGGVYCDQELNEPRAAPLSRRQTPCDYLGPIIEPRDARGNPCACPGKWLRRCEMHGACTIADVERPQVARCLDCADYTGEPGA
jgi:hypothetical protein